MLAETSGRETNNHFAGPTAPLRESRSRAVRIDIREFGREIGTDPEQLIDLSARAHTLYATRWQRRPAGGFRLIQAPSRQLKTTQRKILRFFDKTFVVHRAAKSGFRGAHPLDHALPHVRHAVLITADIAKCFDNVRSDRVGWMLVRLGFDERAAAIVKRLVTRGGALPQGAPTSSILLNLVLLPLDQRLANFARRHHLTYTRYADDLAFSGEYDFGQLLPKIAHHVNRFGFRLSPEKTLIFPTDVEHVITRTIAVDEGIALSRAFKNRLSADAEIAREIVNRGRFNRAELQSIASAVGRLAYARTISPREARRFRVEYFATMPSSARASATALMNKKRRRPGG